MRVASGWEYIKLPQSFYAKDPQGNAFYLGPADVRFPLLDSDMQLEDIATYSFLGCGKFYLQSDGTFSNGRMSLPPVTFELLHQLPEKKRKEQFRLWENLWHRRPEIIRDAVALTRLYPFTNDCIYLSTDAAVPDSFKDIPGLVIFSGNPERRFEEGLGDRKISKPIRQLMLNALTANNRYRPTAWSWFRELFSAFTNDQVQLFLSEVDIAKLQYREAGAAQSWPAAPLHTGELLKGFGLKYLLGKFKENSDGNMPSDFFTLASMYAENRHVVERQFCIETEVGKRDPKRLNLFKYCKDQRVALRMVCGLIISCTEDMGGRPFFRIPSDVPTLEMEGYRVRLPIDKFELRSWGYILSNCIKNGYYKPTNVWGIFRENTLIGACDFDYDKMQPRQISTHRNIAFPKGEEFFLVEMIRKAFAENRDSICPPPKKLPLETFTPVIDPQPVQEAREA